MHHFKLGLFLSLLLASCACTADGTTASQVLEESRCEALLVFLQGQGGKLADLTALDLLHLEAVRLDQNYEAGDLALLAGLPALREVMIWRDGESRSEHQRVPAPTDADLECLASLKQLETLRIGGWSAPYTDAGVAQLVQLPRLKHLHLIQAQRISDTAMQSVARMPALESLNITYTHITDEGLANLVESKSLQRVQYGWAAETRSWGEAFRAAHPECSFILE